MRAVERNYTKDPNKVQRFKKVHSGTLTSHCKVSKGEYDGKERYATQYGCAFHVREFLGSVLLCTPERKSFLSIGVSRQQTCQYTDTSESLQTNCHESVPDD